jgi:hypothetical protein
MNLDTIVPFDPPIQRFITPFEVDSVVEFHASRILLLIYFCGATGSRRIAGRTKLAKLDFFVRYPGFLELALKTLRREGVDVPNFSCGIEGVESKMIRYRYGPWDHRYYSVIAFLAGRELISIRAGSGRTDTYSLTRSGRKLAEQIAALDEFESVVSRCRVVSDVFSEMTGSELKRFVYAAFAEEIVGLPLGSPIDAPLLGED